MTRLFIPSGGKNQLSQPKAVEASLSLDAAKIIKQDDKLKKLMNVLGSKSRSRAGLGAARSAMLEQDRLSVNSHLEELSTVQRWFRTLVSRLAVENPWVNEQFDQLNLALAEGFTNAVRHAHANLPKTTPIDIELSLCPEQLEIRIFDRGSPFDPSSLSEPQPGSLREGGYGWFLLRRLADKVTYDAEPDRRNCLRIVKTAKIV